MFFTAQLISCTKLTVSAIFITWNNFSSTSVAVSRQMSSLFQFRNKWNDLWPVENRMFRTRTWLHFKYTVVYVFLLHSAFLKFLGCHKTFSLIYVSEHRCSWKSATNFKLKSCIELLRLMKTRLHAPHVHSCESVSLEPAVLTAEMTGVTLATSLRAWPNTGAKPSPTLTFAQQMMVKSGQDRQTDARLTQTYWWCAKSDQTGGLFLRFVSLIPDEGDMYGEWRLLGEVWLLTRGLYEAVWLLRN